MKLTLTEFVTLDSVYQAPGGPQEDTSGGFEHGGWVVPYMDEDFGRAIDEIFGRVDAFLLGRRTYDIFAGAWPKVTDPDNPVAGKLNSLPKYVASTTLTSGDWQNTHVIGGAGDLVKEVTALKERPGRELQLHGSGALARTLLQHDLIDTVYLFTYPVVLGAGKRLFDDGSRPTAFRATDSRVTGKGVTITTYDLQGRPEYGEFTEDDM